MTTTPLPTLDAILVELNEEIDTVATYVENGHRHDSTNSIDTMLDVRDTLEELTRMIGLGLCAIAVAIRDRQKETSQ